MIYLFVLLVLALVTLLACWIPARRATRNENAIADVALSVGAISETVTIEGGTTTVQSQSVELSGLVSERRVKELPLNGRNFQKLVLLAPGVGGISGSTTNNPAISGARPVHNTYTIDGMGSNDERLTVGFAGLSNDSGTDLGESVPNIISTEAIQEFRIITTNADATFGRSSGGQININDVRLIGDGRPFYQPDYNNLQPRLGIAWKLDERGRTVLRAGYGVYFDRLIQLQFTGIVTNVPYAISSNTANVPFILGASVPITAAANPAITLVNPALRNPRTQRWNFAAEHLLGQHTTVTVAYVGARGDRLFGQTQINGFGGVPQASRPDPRFSTQQLIDNLGASRYQSLQATAKRRLTRGVDFTVAYTFAQSRDTTSREVFGNVPTLINQGASAATGFQGGGTQFALRSLSVDWGRSEFDVRHNLTFSHLLELPFGKGRRLLGDANGFVNAVIGGWSLTGLAIIRSGEPFNLTRGIDYNDDGDTGADRPQLISGKLNDLYARGSLGRTQFLLPQTEALTRLNTPTQVTDLSLPIERNAFRAARIAAYDLSLIKQFHLTETLRLGFEANAFNLFNRANFSAPNGNLSSALFGRITSTRAGTNPRQIQFGLKLSF